MKNLFKLAQDIRFEENSDEMVSEFISRVNNGEDINIKTSWGDSLICEAAVSGNLDIFKCLVKNGLKPGDYGCVIGKAAAGGNVEIVKMLMDDNIKVDHFALNFAAQDGHIDIVKLFINSSIDVNHQEDIVVESMVDIKTTSDTLLASAARTISSYDDQQMINNKIEVIKYLLDKGADINLHGKFGNTALHWSATDINLEIVSLLVENGADKKAKNDAGKRAFSYAESNDKKAKAIIK